MTVVIWRLEALAVAFVMSGFGVKIGVAGSASSAAWPPSARSFLPRRAMSVIASSLRARLCRARARAGAGLLSATAAQLLLFGSVTVVGLFMLFTGHVRNAMSLISRSARGE